MSNREEFEKEVERGNFIRAAAIAEGIGLPKYESDELRKKALCQMAGTRNSTGIRELARQYGFSAMELNRVLKDFYQKIKNEGNNRLLEAAYDFQTGKYFSLIEWIDHYFERRDLL